MNGELLRLVDTIHRDKNIDKEIVFAGIEQAFLSAVKKQLGLDEGVTVEIDRMTGAIHARYGDREIEPGELGRIAAQTAKQVMIQRIREAERDALYEEFKDRVGSIANGMVQRQESGCTIVNLGKTEAILPRSEQIPGEEHSVGERIRALVIDVRKVGQRVKVVLSRTHPDFIRRLFELEVPEIAERTIEIKALAREAGHRTKVAVASYDSRVDAVGACVGVRGRRIRNIVEELGGEKIDIVRWNESSQVLIMNALKPAEIDQIILAPETGRATVVVPEDQLSLAIGKKGQNVRLAARLSGWNIDIVTAGELAEQREQARREFLRLSGVGPKMADRLVEAGFISVRDLLESGPEVLMRIEGMGEKKVGEVLASASELLPELEAEAAERAAEMAARAQAEAERLAQERAEEQAAAEAEAAEIAAARERLEALGQAPPITAGEGEEEKEQAPEEAQAQEQPSQAPPSASEAGETPGEAPEAHYEDRTGEAQEDLPDSTAEDVPETSSIADMDTPTDSAINKDSDAAPHPGTAEASTEAREAVAQTTDQPVGVETGAEETGDSEAVGSADADEAPAEESADDADAPAAPPTEEAEADAGGEVP